MNHFINYMICEAPKGSSLGDQAFHPKSYTQSQIDDSSENRIKINIDYYKQNQIINPIERLLEPIEGFDIKFLNQTFGINNKEIQ